MTTERETNFIGTVSGNRFDLDTWQISKISLEDIAAVCPILPDSMGKPRTFIP